METKETPNFDGTEGAAENPAAVESAAPTDKPDDVLRVRYNGSSNLRVLTRRDLVGPGASDSARALVLSSGQEFPLSELVELANGDEARVRSVLSAHSFEFALVGPGASEYFDADDSTDFEIGGETK